MENLLLTLKIASVFIGTIVGAGLASGQEIIQFFTVYGLYGVLGIISCGIMYIITGMITVKLSYKYNASSYKDLIYLSCGKYLGAIIDSLTTFFLFCGNCIILAGSGSLLSEAFGLPPMAGTVIMALLTASAVLNSTKGLIFINSIIVPFMILIISSISFTFIQNNLHIFKYSFNVPPIKNNWFFSSIIYTSFNVLLSSGVLCPLTRDIKNPKSVINGVIIGSVLLFLLTLTINLVLLIKLPEVFIYSIPMLCIAKNIGGFFIAALSAVIWMEMFSTEVSNIYSLAKKMQYNLKMDYKFSVILIIIAALPFTKIGFSNLIKILYPPFGAVSLIYILFLIKLYYKN